VGVERAFAPALFDLLVASIVGAAFRIDVARKGDPFAIRRPERIANSRGNIGELSGFATAGGDDVRLSLSLPSRELMKAIDLPSGEKLGDDSPFSPNVNWRVFLPSASISQMWPVRLAFSQMWPVRLALARSFVYRV